MLIKLLRTFLHRYRRQLLIVLAFTFVQTMCTLFLPALNASIIDNGVITGDTDYIWKLGGVMLVVTFVQVGFTIAAVYFGPVRRWRSGACSSGAVSQGHWLLRAGCRRFGHRR